MIVTYSKKFSKNRNKIIVEYCKDKKVLHIGACDAPYTVEKFEGTMGPLLYSEIDTVCKSQLGIDLDIKSIEFLNNKKSFKKSNLIPFNMNELSKLDFTPDVIIFGEVIEHLMNLEIALLNLRNVMSSDTILIISTPNVFYISNFIRAIFGYENMHEDHKVLFSFGYIKNLLIFNELEIDNAYFTFLDRNNDNLSFSSKLVRSLIMLISSTFPGISETLLIISRTKGR